MAAKEIRASAGTVESVEEEGFVFISADRVVGAMREMTLEPIELGAVNGTACINSECTNNRCSNGFLCRNAGCSKNRRKCEVEVEPTET